MNNKQTHNLHFGVAAYSFPCGCGFARRGEQCIETPLDAWGLIDLATESRLSSVEFPFHGSLPDLSDATIERLRARLDEAGLDLIVDTPILDEANLRTVLPAAARAGAKVVRAMVSGVLEGARTGFSGGWDAHLVTSEKTIRAVLPLLEEYDLVLALENHQDVTSTELLALCQALGPRVGVTLDAANPLAVGEDVLEFARRVGPHIRNVHIKDYTIHATSSGYRLVRAAVGDGVIPWEVLLPQIQEAAPNAYFHIELAALYGRHIRIFEDDWWQGFPPTDVRAALPAMRFLARHARAESEPWETPWERGETFADVAHWEMEQFHQSVTYLRGLNFGQ